MTKKQSIWLGIRAIGVYWLITLIFSSIVLITQTVSYLTRIEQTDHFLIPALVRLSGKFLFHFTLAMYFLFFGTLVYKLISHFVRSRPEDLSKPAGYCYCETIVRCMGAWFLGKFLSGMIFAAFVLPLQSHIILRITNPELLEKQGGNIFSFSWPGASFFLIMLPLWAIYILIPVYFLKKGNFFINLLNRLWLKAAGNERSADPVHAV